MATKKYQHLQLEKKWQQKWAKDKANLTPDDFAKEKFYILDMFPYPSGAGLHVGHPKGYIATDIYARMMGMRGKNVLHPMGWDAFGLPAENHALKTGEKPAVATAKNITTFKKQLNMLGLGYDWEREVNTTDPSFYKWTQWIFLKLWDSYYDADKNKALPIQKLIDQTFGKDTSYYDLNAEDKKIIDAHRLAFASTAPINWCPSCQTGLANEDLEHGRCERCDSMVELRPMKQWKLRITKYADRMLDDLKLLTNWEDFIKSMQTNWIGKKTGLNIIYEVKGPRVPANTTITTFTTRPDTNFGATFVVVAPESEFVARHLSLFPHHQAAAKYVNATKHKSELERIAEGRAKTGVDTGWVAINHLTGKEMPIFIADFVLAAFGTGHVVGVPGHDLRDFEFAEAFNLPVIRVVQGSDGDFSDITSPDQVQEENGTMVNSDFLNGLDIHAATEKIMDYMEIKGWGERVVNYRLQDWVFSRQRYWGEPIPMIHCPKCGLVPVPESELPVTLPDVEHYEPSGTGESPLVNIKDWINVKCPLCSAASQREANTMPQWAGSSWYYLRYADPINNSALIDPKKEKHWQPVDFYVGGAEHATRHLIYARFWHKFLFDLGVVSHPEPFTRLQHVGLIMAEDGRKMSKRWNNVVNPDDVVREFGADAMRVYEMFMGPFGDSVAWSTQGVVGCRKFLDKVWELQTKLSSIDFDLTKAVPELVSSERPSPETKSSQIQNHHRGKLCLILHQTIQKVTTDILSFKLNTAVSAMMILANAFTKAPTIDRHSYEKFLLLLAPFAPHLCEEIWANLGHDQSIFLEDWPVVDSKIIAAAAITIIIQINGKLRAELICTPEEARDQDLVISRAKNLLYEKNKLDPTQVVRKEIYVPNKIINLVV
ncbi:leucine--tRNA ligase [Microgenomates group bacterium]|nr:leucine--tRNA ligase [Microgenomates group bacterium]